ncbi:SIR2 family protein [Pedobacter namyangjuensis]|uniref:SIR2 family protein n=1 Tax=Pedobacter namyangjuensis TaxID=600626 RepID=UPI0013B3ADDB|nr:SIR2 family protein [Pedobacter namyangjuensis]
MDYLKHLKDLRTKLAGQQMSLLIGSGLSKNVSEKFPLWNEMLVDLAYELHQDGIDRDYLSYKSNLATPLGEAEFRKAACGKIISTKGSLEIVSEYIRVKGIPESIVSYIEDKVPCAYRKDGKYFMELNGDIEEIPKEKLALHRALIELPWNNIFTTNYDHLLDICIDDNRYERLSDEIDTLYFEILQLQQKIANNESELESIEAPELTYKPTGDPSKALEQNIPEPTEENQSRTNRRNELFYAIHQGKMDLKNLEDISKDKIFELNGCYRIVTSAQGLSTKKQKNIVKLHGSLRSLEQRESHLFGFDNDSRKHYIISKEHYDSYPELHEAFTQVMRISLLQESFCLIGFSGVDPNFLGWINWVRDILSKSARTAEGKKTYKIYLVETSCSTVPKDRQLFFENHNIIRIPLLDPVVISAMQADVGRSSEVKDRSTSLELFLAFLNNDDHLKPDLPTANLAVRREQRQLWDRLPVIDPLKIADLPDLSSTLSKLEKISGEIWIPDLGYASMHNQHSLTGFSHTKNFFPVLLERDDIQQMVTLAIQQLYIPIRNIVTSELVEQLLKNPLTSTAIVRMIQRNDVLEAVSDRHMVDIHDEMLRLAYSFQFDTLLAQLQNWEPEGKDVILRAGLFSLFNQKDAREGLERAILEDKLERGEQMLYGLEMLNHIPKGSFGGDKRIMRMIASYEQTGYRPLQETIKRLYGQIDKQQSKVRPYGQNRYSRSRSMQMTRTSEAEASIQILMLLAESGFQMMIRNIYLLPNESWHKIFKAGFDYYPMPFLFYSLQYNNKDLLKKIGQEYAFSTDEKITSRLTEICTALFGLLDQKYSQFTNASSHVLSTMIIGVSPHIWQEYFSALWKKLIELGIAFDKEHDDHHVGLVNTAIKFINSPELLVSIISDCIQQAAQGPADQAIGYLYHLNRNFYFKKLDKNPLHRDFISQKLEKIIEDLSVERIELMFILGNLHDFLNKKQLWAIPDKLAGFELEKIDTARVWRIITYFSQNHPELKKKSRTCILGHRLLWHTGINGNSIAGGIDEHIPLTAISSPSLGEKSLRWEPHEIEAIYNRLVPTLNDIDRFDLQDSWISFTDVLEEMCEFLDTNAQVLEKFPDYVQVAEMAKLALAKNRNFEDIGEGLTSSDHNEFLTAISEMSEQVYAGQMDSELVTVLLNKLLLQSEPGIEATLSYIASWASDKDRPDRFRIFQGLITKILVKYDRQMLEDCDIAFVEEYLIRLAFMLYKWGVEDPIVETWLQRGRASSFNNVIQFLLKAEIGNEIDQWD